MKIIYIFLFLFSSLLYSSSEYKIKAVYIYNIANFVQWQDDTFKSNNANFNIAILGNDDFGESINILKDKKIATHPITITTIPTLKDVDKFQIIFISKSETDNLHEIKRDINNKTVLLISDIEDYALKGGHIEIKTVVKKLKLIINNNAALKSNIRISSKLLKISKIVDTK